jgi:hypothetical protein
VLDRLRRTCYHFSSWEGSSNYGTWPLPAKPLEPDAFWMSGTTGNHKMLSWYRIPLSRRSNGRNHVFNYEGDESRNHINAFLYLYAHGGLLLFASPCSPFFSEIQLSCDARKTAVVKSDVLQTEVGWYSRQPHGAKRCYRGQRNFTFPFFQAIGTKS